MEWYDYGWTSVIGVTHFGAKGYLYNFNVGTFDYSGRHTFNVCYIR